MSRIRNIKPDFFDDEGLATVSSWARLCFIGLWTQADREGRLEDRPSRLKARLFPFDKVNVAHLIDELVTEGCVIRYQVDGANLLYIPRFSKHQYLSKREPASTLPGIDGAQTGTVPVLDQSKPGLSDMDQDKRSGQGTGIEIPTAASPVEEAWTDWRTEWNSHPKWRQLPAIISPLDFQKVLELSKRFPDRPYRQMLLRAYFNSTNKQILKNAFTVGWFLHWADKLAADLRAADEQDQATKEWLET